MEFYDRMYQRRGYQGTYDFMIHLEERDDDERSDSEDDKDSEEDKENKHEKARDTLVSCVEKRDACIPEWLLDEEEKAALYLKKAVENAERVWQSQFRVRCLTKALEKTENVEEIQLRLASITYTGPYEFSQYIEKVMCCYEQDSDCLQVVEAIWNRFKHQNPDARDVCHKLRCYQAAVQNNRSREVLQSLCPVCPERSECPKLLAFHVSSIVKSAFEQKNATAIVMLYENNWQFSCEEKTKHFRTALELKMRDLAVFLARRSRRLN